MNKNQFVKEKLKEFDEKFKCIQGDCDGNGHIPKQINEDEWTSHQCQFHAEYLFPIRTLYKLSLEEAWEKGMWDQHAQEMELKEREYPTN